MLPLGMALLCAVACQPPSADSDDPGAPSTGPSALAGAVPVPGRHLDRASATNDGVLAGSSADGVPVLDGPNVDPRIIEARRFYDTLQYPGAEPQPVSYPNPFTGQMEPTRKTAPLTLEKWKQVFGFQSRQPGESLPDFRRRTGVVVYYNKNELGLGRELGCAEFDDSGGDSPGNSGAAAGQAGKGVACYVSNFGAGFNDPHGALAMAVDGSEPRNTVCITYRPSMARGYEVQFYAFGADGRRQEWAQLDTMGARPQPQVCMNCHGGVYDDKRHLARNARFLPLDPNLVAFAEDAPTNLGVSRAAQEEPMRAMNQLALRTPLTPGQREMLRELYQGQVEQPGARSATTWAPKEWQRTPEEAQLYDKVVKPYCATCHLAIFNKHEAGELPWYGMFQSLDKLRRFPMTAVVCGNFSMPNAQPTLAHFWDESPGPVTIGDKVHSSPAAAFLDAFGADLSSCDRLPVTATCNRGPDPDSLCGNAASGARCDRDTGRCVVPQ